jgi:hypothetical protein
MTAPRRVRVNQLKDWAERTFWTFVNTWLGLLTVSSFTGVNLDALHQLEVSLAAAAFTTVKTLAAQHVGNSNDGAAIPGGITEPAGPSQP